MVETLQEYHKVMVALDGSEQSERAFEKGVRLARLNHAVLVLCSIVDIRSFNTEEPIINTDLYDELSKNMNAQLDQYAKTAQEHGVDHVKTLVELGSPKELLAIDIPQSEKIDLILCGQSGLNAVERFIMGSVSSYIINHAQCDVMVVPIEETHK